MNQVRCAALFAFAMIFAACPRDGAGQGWKGFEPVDAGDDPAVEDAGRVPQTPCDTKYLCANPRALTFDHYTLDTGLFAANIGFDPAIETPSGPVLPWSAIGCCGETNDAVFGLLPVSDPTRSKLIVGPAPMTAMGRDTPIPATRVGGSVLFVNFANSFRSAKFVDPSTLRVKNEQSIPLEGDETNHPAVRATSSGLVAAIATPPTILQLDSNYKVVGRHPYDFAETGIIPRLTETCDGFLAFWTVMGLRVVRCDRTGAPVGEALTYEDWKSYPYMDLQAPVWDGRHVVTVDESDIVEFAIDGTIVRRTPLPGVLAAVGTEAGLVAVYDPVTAEVHERQTQVVLIERGTGTILSVLGTVLDDRAGGSASLAVVGGEIILGLFGINIVEQQITVGRIDCY